MPTSKKKAGPQVKLPGFGLPRDHGLGDPSLFPHALLGRDRGHLSKGICLRERRMLDFIGTITDKPDWHRKVFEEFPVSQWRKEAMNEKGVDGDVYMSTAMFDHCIAELRDKATRLESVGFVSVLDSELSVVKSDHAVSDRLAESLRECAKKLEDVPDRQKDWHPGSEKQVLDLLHPSLFPLVFGKSRALKTGKVPLDDCVEYIGQGQLVEEGPPIEGVNHDQYQWLPSDVTLAESGASITSYINNLHPKYHKDLYAVLEKTVDAAVPLWEECLSWWEDRRRFVLKRTCDEEDYYLPEGVTYRVPRAGGEGFHGDGEGDADSTGSVDSEDYKWSDEYVGWWKERRILRFPEPAEFVPFEQRVDLANKVCLRDQFPQGLQVIFKLANIHLTPENPNYDGGRWHVEGTLSEHICATALYYYDEENITPSRLAFRQGVDEEELMVLPEQYSYNSAERYFGVELDGVAIQELGSVLTRPGRLLAFPNVLQHRVGSFKLQDPSKPGHRKILAMFLVDPHCRVLSTANVPPQRLDWWAAELRKTRAFERLPAELFLGITERVDTFPISWNEALAIREDLMAQRGRFAHNQEKELQEYTFSFCEH